MARRWRPQGDASRSMDADDRLQAARLGVLEGLDGYDGEHPLRPYLWMRASGRVVDSLRALDPLERRAREQVKQLRLTTHRLQGALGRPPTRAELATVLAPAWGPETLEEIEELSRLRHVSASSGPADGDAEHDPLETLASEPRDVDDELDTPRIVAALHRALAQLPDEEREVITLRYLEGLTLEQLAEVIGRSTPVVRKRLQRGAEALAKALAPYGALPPELVRTTKARQPSTEQEIVETGGSNTCSPRSGHARGRARDEARDG